MDPELERRLTEEVIYLHSLWQQGPPTNPNPNPNLPVTSHISNLNPFNADNKTRNRKNHKKKKKNQSQDPGPEWPCPNPVQIPAPTSSGWPAFDPTPTTAVQLRSPEERAELAALRLQNKEFAVFREFFTRNSDSESDEEDDDDEELKEGEEYKFFLKFFVEKSDLRNYYENNSESGSFCCLVCGGMGKKNSGKRFKSCVGILQHAIAMSNTENRRAHRAFGLVICRVMGWDISRLPMIVLKDDPLGRSLGDSCDSKVQLEETRVADEHDLNTKNSIDGDEDGSEESTIENSHSNGKDSISSESENACKEKDEEENGDDSISGKIESEGLPVR